MNKSDYDVLVLHHNDGGPPLLPIGRLEFGEIVYLVNGRLAVNLGGGWLAVDRNENVRGINDVDIY